ncbi:MAG: FixH family protein [Cyanobacteria bacterium NC_groundwater_1444_Ag_S-0.65um_54_12]|nr:FixH family protein [Cyanobacteria bacterium NC_groundwater_1444_Ag_S-0.65um_54_12]
MFRHLALGVVLTLAWAPVAWAGVIKSQTTGTSKVTLSSTENYIVAGNNDITVTITDTKGKPKKATVSSLSFNMPAMGTMAAMKSTAELKPGKNPGEYTGKVNVGMTGSWKVVIAYKDERGNHRANMQIVAR